MTVGDSDVAKAELQALPCIAVDIDARSFDARGELMTVATYKDVRARRRREERLWATRAPRVEELTTEWRPYSVRVVNLPAYNSQMRVLLGLEDRVDPGGTT